MNARSGLSAARDEPLREDIRRLGRVRGDTIREQEGEAVFASVEAVRRTAVSFAPEHDPAPRNELAAQLDPAFPARRRSANPPRSV